MPARLAEAEAIQQMMTLGNATPLEPYPGTKKPWRCRCNQCGEVITPRLGCIRSGQGACRHCGSQAGGEKLRLSEAEAIQDMREIGNATPLEPYPGTMKPWRCRCNECGQVVTPRLGGVRNHRYLACRGCANKKNGDNQRFDPDWAAEEMRRLGNVTPLVAYPGSHESWRCRCNECGDIVNPRFADIRRGVGACATCGHVKTGLKRRIPEQEAVALMEAQGNATPLVSYPGSRLPWKCRCNECSEIIYPQLSNVLSGQGACLNCAKYGFKTDEPALVYLLHHRQWKAFKVGVAGIDTSRVKDHSRDGWKCLFTVELATGRHALNVESMVFRRLSEMGVPRGYVLPEQMRTGGHTETISDALISQSEVQDLIETGVREVEGESAVVTKSEL